MEISWVTVAAQIVNFLILVWLLHKFLYGPIVKAMAQREEQIRKRKAEAEAEKEAAAKARQALDAARAQLAMDREMLLAEARAEAEKVRRGLEAEARGETDAMRRAWFDQLATEQDEFLADIREKGAEAIVDVCRTALRALADENLEQKIITAFSEKLESIPATSREKIMTAVRRHGGEVKIESAFPLAVEDQLRIAESLHRVLDPAVGVGFEEADDLVAGIRLHADSQIVEWSFNSYLDQLAGRLDEALAIESPAERERAAE